MLWNGTFDTNSGRNMYEMWKTMEDYWHDTFVVQPDKVGYHSPVETTEINITGNNITTRNVAKI